MEKSQNSGNQGFSYYFCLMIEGFGSIPLTKTDPDPIGLKTYGSGSATLPCSVSVKVFIFRQTQTLWQGNINFRIFFVFVKFFGVGLLGSECFKIVKQTQTYPWL